MSVNQKLVYDVGHHLGEDTEFYLKKGFEVVAIEANPRLIEQSKTRFKDAIASRQLHLVEGAIGPATAGEKITFFDNPRLSVWGTINPDWALRNARVGHPSEAIEVDRLDIAEIYRAFGIPFYLKIDVEGVDLMVLEELQSFPDRPQYVSIESDKVSFRALRDELELLARLGYRKFKAVQQADIPGNTIETLTLDGSPMTYTFEKFASGAFGEDIPQPWLTFEEALREYRSIFLRYRLFGEDSVLYRMPERIQRAVLNYYPTITGYKGPLPGWYDTHASL